MERGGIRLRAHRIIVSKQDPMRLPNEGYITPSTARKGELLTPCFTKVN